MGKKGNESRQIASAVSAYMKKFHMVNPGEKILVGLSGGADSVCLFLLLLSLREEMGFDLYWDGACSADKIVEYAPKGVKGFVLGTTLLFGKESPYAETLKNIREMRF